MAGNTLYADTDKLDSPVFEEFKKCMQNVIDELKSLVAANVPVAQEEFDASDTQLNKSVKNACDFILFMVTQLRDLCKGNADQVAFLSQVMKDVEEINNQVANFDGTGDGNGNRNGSRHH